MMISRRIGMLLVFVCITPSAVDARGGHGGGGRGGHGSGGRGRAGRHGGSGHGSLIGLAILGAIGAGIWLFRRSKKPTTTVVRDGEPDQPKSTAHRTTEGYAYDITHPEHPQYSGSQQKVGDK